MELILDAWISFNVTVHPHVELARPRAAYLWKEPARGVPTERGLNDYVARLVEVLKPYRLKWLEDYLLPEGMDSYFKACQRVTGQILATGEHWYTIHPFALAVMCQVLALK